jgi:hypothetical protein
MIGAGVAQTSVGVTWFAEELLPPPEPDPEQPLNGNARHISATHNLLT